MNVRNIEKYLRSYAEQAEIAIVPELVATLQGTAPWDYVVAVPACMERESLPALCASLAAATNTDPPCRPLIVIVINHRASATLETKENNAATWEHFKGMLDTPTQSSGSGSSPWLFGTKASLSYLIIDRFSTNREFPEKQGVGLARKIGSDIATALIFARLVKSPYIFNTDADAIVGTDYFDCSELDPNPLATQTFLTPFTHQIPGTATINEAKAITLYDRYLRIYVAGLERAKSAYAFPTVGSTIGYQVNAYTAVRGFPRREAGEDFYLLNKLAKVGAITTRNVKPLVLQGRISYRVPFGTGASVGKISQILERGEAYTIYDDRSYNLLKIWLENALLYLSDGSKQRLIERLNESISTLEIPEAFTTILKHLEDSGALAFLESARSNAKNQEQIIRSFTDWFDAFRTLKFIHAIRDTLLPALPLL